MFEAAGNKPEKYWWPVIGDVDLTPNQLINLPPEIRQQIEEATLKRFGVLPAGAARTGAAPTGAAPTGAGGVNVANIEKVESGGNAAAVSPKGAQGAMQVMPNTQRDPGFGVRPAADNSPAELTRVGQDYYGAMQNRYGHDTLAAIAYNMGPGKTDEWLKSGADFNKLPAETQAYIGKVNLANAMQNRQVATAPARAVDLAKPMPDNFPVVAGEELQASQRFTPPAPVTAPPAITAPAPAPVAAPAPAPVAAPAPAAPATTAARSPTAPIEFNEPRPSSSDPKYKSRGQYEADVQTWERKRDAAIKIQEEFQKELVKGTAENIILDEKAFRATTEPKSVAERKTSAERVVQLVRENPKAVGILAEPGIAKALATIVRDGLNTPSGAVGVKTIEEALAKTMPGTSQTIINARNEIAQNLARGALEASKLSQGQGSVSDFERTMFEKIAGSLADTPELLIKRQQMLISRANLDQQLGRMYRASRTGGGVTDYEKFMSRPDVEKLIDAYEENLRGILGSSASAPTAGTTPGGIKFKVITPGKTQ
jgi:soluble lytic murein transglycosylase-like protein